MKKILIITILLLLSIGVVSFLVIESRIDKQVEEAFDGLNLNFSQKTSATEEAELETPAEEKEVPGEKVNRKKPSRSFSLQAKELNNFAYNEGRVFRWTYRNGEVYILDDAEQQFLTLNPKQGTVNNRFGEKGGAPWENEGISSFEVKGDDLYTLDQNKMSIRKSSVQNPREVDYFYKSKTGFWDGCLLNEDTYLVLADVESGEKGDFRFDVLDANTGEVKNSYDFRKLAGITGNAKHLNVAYEGYFLRNERNEVFYVCSKAGRFFKFNSDGTFGYQSNTLDNRPAPKVTTKTFGNATVYIKDPDMSTNYSASVDDQFLYILSLVRFVRADQLVVDRYDIQTGQYHSSVELPNHKSQLPTEILKLDGKELLVLYEDMQIVRYELQ
jgi:hypothetical protein